MRRRLLQWYDRSARDLPWRGSVDPYAIWISEVMLQQTRVEAVRDHYGRFLSRFPTLSSLAAAAIEDVLSAWTGLGYYRRARLLHSGARHVMDEHAGVLPPTRAQLERVPGIGSYTAGAIASIAYGRREAAIDANVARVIMRVLTSGTGTAPIVPDKAVVAEAAGELVRTNRPGDVNQAMMDLGAGICTARRTDCEACPLQRMCGARRLGVQLAVPPPRPRKPPRDVSLCCAVVRCGGRALMVRRAEDDALLGGIWELPTVEHEDASLGRQRLHRVVRAAAGTTVRLLGPQASVRHDIVGRRIVAHIFTGEAAAERGGGDAEAPRGRFFSEQELEGAALSSLPLKILRASGFLAPQPRRAARAAART